jgi:hypothetical protein
MCDRISVKECQIVNFIKIHPVGVALYYADRQRQTDTDREAGRQAV